MSLGIAERSSGKRSMRAAAVLAAGLCAAWPASAAKRDFEAPPLLGDEQPLARSSVRIQQIDFAPEGGATTLGITAAAPLTNHTAYETGDSLVIEIPEADVSALEPRLAIGTAQVESISIEASGRVARFTIRRAPGTRRTVALDPSNPNRLVITLQGAASDALTSTPMPAVPPAQPRVLASAPAVPASNMPMTAEDRLAESAPSRAVSIPSTPIQQVAQTQARPLASLSPQPAGHARRGGHARLISAAVERSEDGRTVVRLDGVGSLEPRPQTFDDPPRIAFDFAGTINGVQVPSIPVRDSQVLKVRIAQNTPLPDPVTRVVVDLAAQVPYEIVAGPDSLLIVFGTPTASARTMASAAPFRVDPAAVGAGRAEDVAPSTDGPTHLANIGRPASFSGASVPPMAPRPHVAESSGLLVPPARRMRETADGSIAVSSADTAGTRYEAVQVVDTEQVFSGDPISISVKDADLQDLFRLFHQVSGLNIVVDPAVKGKTITLELYEVPWDQALDLVLRTQGLGQALEGNVLRVAPLTKMAQEEQQKRQLHEARENAGDLSRVAIPLSYADGKRAEVIVRKALSPRGDVTLDIRTNTLIVNDLPRRLDEIRSVLEVLDRPTRQVTIEARIVETTLDFSKAVGIQWGFSYIADRAFGTETGFSFPRNVLADYAVNLPVQASNATLGLSFRNILNTFALDLAISSLEDRGKARIISRPMIMVQNNEQAEIESGVQIPITNTTATETDVTFVSASLRLNVTPQITADDNVIMALRVENNAPVFIQTVGDNASIATRQARTTVAVPDGGTTVIGGIYQVNEGTTSSRVPFLNRIPLLGWLFRNKTINRTNDELLIFLTPRIQRT